MKFEYIPNKEKFKCYSDDKKELKSLKSYLTRRPENYFHDPLFKLKLWNGFNSKYDGRSNTFPLGLWQEAVMCCKEYDYKYSFINPKKVPLNRDVTKEHFVSWVKDFFKNTDKYELREYQLDAAWSIIKNRYGNISVATSGGKTFIYALVTFYLFSEYENVKFLLVVPSKTLVKQFYDDLLAYDYENKIGLNIQEIYAENEKPRIVDENKKPDLVISTFQSLVYEKKIAVRKAKVDGKMINIPLSDKEIKEYKENKKKLQYAKETISNYPEEWYKQFWSITIDEGHRGGAASYSEKILKYTLCNAYYRWGMSGSFPKNNTEEMMQIMAKTGPVHFKIGARALMDMGYITPVKIKRLNIYHNNFLFQHNIELISKRDKKRMYDLEAKKIQYRDERIDVISNIIEKTTMNTLVLFHNEKYGIKLLDRLKEKNPDKIFHFINGKTPQTRTKNNIGLNRDDIKEAMKNDTSKIHVLVASYGTLSTGVSISSIGVAILAQSFKSPQIIIQSIGRALRLHESKKWAYIFDIIDIFNRDDLDFANRSARKFENTLYKHGKDRQIIYDEEEYPYTDMDIQLPDVFDDDVLDYDDDDDDYVG